MSFSFALWRRGHQPRKACVAKAVPRGADGPASLLILLLSVLLPATAFAAFDLGGLSKAIGGAAGSPAATGADSDKLTKLLDTAKDAGKVLKGITGIGPEEEKVIGDSVALEIVGKYGGLVRDEATMQRVNLIGRSLARYCERPDLNWRFGVMNSDSVNAFSAPDGYVFITRGLYALADNDDALAAILGHEIAHITGKHALKIVQRGEFLSGLGSQVVKRSGNTRELDAKLKQFDLGVTDITKTLFEKGFDPQTEYAADLNGRQLALTTGYAPGGLFAVLTKLQQQGGAQKMFSTHPPLAERIKRLPNDSVVTAAEPAARLTSAPAANRTTPATPAIGKAAAMDTATPEKAASTKIDEDDQAFLDAAEKKPAKGKKN